MKLPIIASRAEPDTLYNAANSGPDLSDSSRLGTLRKIAAVGRRVVVTFEPMNESGAA